jgi:hypothetical protein
MIRRIWSYLCRRWCPHCKRLNRKRLLHFERAERLHALLKESRRTCSHLQWEKSDLQRRNHDLASRATEALKYAEEIGQKQSHGTATIQALKDVISSRHFERPIRPRHRACAEKYGFELPEEEDDAS